MFRLSGLLCLFALLATMALGPNRIFVCACDDVPQFTSAAGCSVESGGQCDAENGDESGQPGGETPDQNHQHFAARDDLNASALAKLDVPMAPLICFLPRVTLLESRGGEMAKASPTTQNSSDSPPPPVLVVRAVVFLI